MPPIEAASSAPTAMPVATPTPPTTWVTDSTASVRRWTGRAVDTGPGPVTIGSSRVGELIDDATGSVAEPAWRWPPRGQDTDPTARARDR